MKPFTSKHCAQYLSKTSPLEKSDPTKKMTQSVEPANKKKEETRYLAPPPETTGGKGLRKMSKAELMRRDISYQNDSLRKLPKTDLNYLPTFNTNTDEGSDAQEVYYSNKKNLKRLKELDRPIRQQYGF